MKSEEKQTNAEASAAAAANQDEAFAKTGTAESAADTEKTADTADTEKTVQADAIKPKKPMQEGTASPMSQKETIRRILRVVGRYRIYVLFSLLFAALTVALTLYIPVLIGRAVDCIAGPGQVDMRGLGRILLRIGAAALLSALFQWLMNHINNTITYRVVEDIRISAVKKIEELPLSFLDAHPAGDLVSRIIADTDQFSDGILLGFTQFFTGVMTILGTLLFMLRINAVIALAVILLTPLSFFVARFIATRSYRLFGLHSKTRGSLTALTDEMINDLKLVKAFSYEAEARERFHTLNQTLGRYFEKATFISSITNPATRFVNAVVYAAVGILGSFFAIRGFMSVGQLTSFLSYANQYTKPFNEISGVVTELQNAIASAGRVFEITDAVPQKPDAPDALSLRTSAGEVEIRGMSFSYTPDQRLIEDLNLSVRPGERVAIVGPTGSGKSTLINLLMRFYDPQKGHILVDGHDTQDVTRASLRRNFGMVLQETWLKSGTIRENISYGRPEAAEAEIVAAAKEAYADSFIRRMPHGYDTQIGEDGGMLSQGQKQLLCIARVMLQKPPMLILDEATSSIDTMTEQRVQSAFLSLMQGRTSFVVAHRLSTIRGADAILVMRDGHIVEQGTHEELMARQGFYYRLYMSQFGTDERYGGAPEQ